MSIQTLQPLTNATEISRSRHVQYCRRRAARNRPPRPKACNPCRRSKSKCDFERPCSRCVEKGLTCSYGARQDTVTSTAISQSQNTAPGGSVVAPESVEAGIGVPLSSGGSGVTPVAPSQRPGTLTEFGSAFDGYGSQAGYIGQEDPINLPERSSFTSTSLAGNDLNMVLSSPDSSNLDIDHFLRSGHGDYQNIFSDLLSPPGKDASVSIFPSGAPFIAPGSPSHAHTDDRSLVLIPDRTNNPPARLGNRRISASCRRFALSIIRTYPRLLTPPRELPLFIHPVGCGLHFDHRDDCGLDNITTFAPLGPLATCQGIAQLLVSRIPNTTEFLWRTVENERRVILKEVDRLIYWARLGRVQGWKSITYPTNTLRLRWMGIHRARFSRRCRPCACIL